MKNDVNVGKSFDEYFDIVKKLKCELYNRDTEYGKPNYFKAMLNKYVTNMINSIEDIDEKTKNDIIEYFIKSNNSLFSLVVNNDYINFNKYIKYYEKFLKVYLISRYNYEKKNIKNILDNIFVELNNYASDISKFDTFSGLNYNNMKNNENISGEELIKLETYNDNFIHFVEFNISLLKSNYDIYKYVNEINKIDFFLVSYKKLVKNNLFDYNIVNLRTKVYNLFFDFINKIRSELNNNF